MSDEERVESGSEREARPIEAARRGPPSLPMRVGDAPFRNMLAIPEAAAGYLAEAKREIRVSALRRLETLDQLYRQLVHQAEEVVTGARRDLRLHDVPVNAAKIRGKIYHLYRRPRSTGGDGRTLFFSLLAPHEYAQADAGALYLASYQLNEDSSWTHLEGDETEPWLEGDGGR